MTGRYAEGGIAAVGPSTVFVIQDETRAAGLHPRDTGVAVGGGAHPA